MDPSCVGMLVYACACNGHAYAWLECMYAYTCMRAHALGFSWPFFYKIIYLF